MREPTLITLLLLALGTTWAKDGAAIYKSECARCHGAQGDGGTGPKLAGTSLSEVDIVNVLTKGGKPEAPHMKPYMHEQHAQQGCGIRENAQIRTAGRRQLRLMCGKQSVLNEVLTVSFR